MSDFCNTEGTKLSPWGASCRTRPCTPTGEQCQAARTHAISCRRPCRRGRGRWARGPEPPGVRATPEVLPYEWKS
eukprot:5616035-Pyramimonas_sp.AAC.1